MVKWLVCLLLTSSMGMLYAQDETVIQEQMVVDSISQVDQSELYLQEGYYDSIPQAVPYDAQTGESFEEMVGKYQSEEFEYAESITSKLSFLERVIKRFWKFVEDFFPKMDNFSQQDLYHILAFVGIVLLLYLFYYFFIGKNRLYTHIRREPKEEISDVAFVERNLMDVDVRRYIDEALQNKDYALAIRYQQLLTIQLLNRKERIDWDYTKTNQELMEDVQDQELKNGFMACSAIFDRVWFGERLLKEEDYAHFASLYEQFQRRWS